MIQFGIERHPLFGWVRLKASARTKTEGIQTPARKILSGRIRAWKQMGKVESGSGEKNSTMPWGDSINKQGLTITSAHNVLTSPYQLFH